MSRFQNSLLYLTFLSTLKGKVAPICDTENGDRRYSESLPGVLGAQAGRPAACSETGRRGDAACSLGSSFPLWPTNWPCPWMRRSPAPTANGVPAPCRGCSAPTSRSSAQDTKPRTLPAWDGSACSGSARPSNDSCTAGTTRRASRGSNAPIPTVKPTTFDPSAARCSTSAPPHMITKRKGMMEKEGKAKSYSCSALEKLRAPVLPCLPSDRL